MAKTKEIEVNYKGKQEKVVIKIMGWAERNEFRDSFIENVIIGSINQVKVHPFRMQTSAMQKCIVTAPFKTDINSLNEEEDMECLDIIYSHIEKPILLYSRKLLSVGIRTSKIIVSQAQI